MARFVDHAPMGLAPVVEAVPDSVQQILAEQCNLHCHTDELGLQYWYHGDQPEIKHYIAVKSTVDQKIVIPQTFGKRCIQPDGTVDYLHAEPKEVQIYMRPLLIVDSGAVGNVLPVPPIQGRSFEEARLSHMVSGHDEGRSDDVPPTRGGPSPQSYAIGGHIILPHLRYYPEVTVTGSQSSNARPNSGSSRPPVQRPTPTPTPSVPSAPGAARTGTPAPESKRMPRAKPKPRRKAARAPSDTDSNMD